jgi:tripartite-type tricarboxylate transporter receptor subunit TctC
MLRRHFCAALPAALPAAAAIALGLPLPALAAPYPSKPVRLIVPFTPGGSADLLGRIVGEQLARRWGQTVLIENRAGASGHIGAEAVSKSAPDGYNLVLGTTAIHAAYALYTKLHYDPPKALEVVSIIGEFPNVLVVNPSVPAHSVAEFIALAKQKPGTLFFGSAGNGSATHLAAELFEHITATELKHVPYRGSSAAMADLLGGQIQCMFENLPTVLPMILSGKVRALGVTSAARSDSLPGVPSISETVPAYDFAAWYTIAGPVGMPREVAEKLNRDIDAVVHDPSLKAKWKELGVTPIGGSPASIQAYLAKESEKWGSLIRAANLRAD